ncbi:Required for respiratory growth protein 9 mitochondrial [Spathaspora sp. JA1]|nr:Required for respiratory growth protein 9 mitochondrial [Spathaspora sp. JA1]
MIRKGLFLNRSIPLARFCGVKQQVLKVQGNNLVLFPRWLSNKPMNPDSTHPLQNNKNGDETEHDQQKKVPSSQVSKETQELPGKISFEDYQKKILINHKKHNPEATEWKKREIAIKKRYGEWKPTKRLSREDMLKVKELSEQFPNYKTVDLANIFRVSPEAIRRILKSKWVPSDADIDKITARRERQRQEKIDTRQQHYKKFSKGNNYPKQQQEKNNGNGKTLLNKNYNYIGRRF